MVVKNVFREKRLVRVPQPGLIYLADFKGCCHVGNN